MASGNSKFLVSSPKINRRPSSKSCASRGESSLDSEKPVRGDRLNEPSVKAREPREMIRLKVYSLARVREPLQADCS